MMGLRLGREKILRFAAPQGPGVRVDSGFSPGNQIPSAFDSNIAKIICRGGDRFEAMARMQTALRDAIVAIDSGLTNRSLLLELVSETPVREGPVTTKWLDRYLEQRPRLAERRYLPLALAGAAIGDAIAARQGEVANFLTEAATGLPRSVSAPGPVELRYTVDSAPVTVEVAKLGPALFMVRSGAWAQRVVANHTGACTMILGVRGAPPVGDPHRHRDRTSLLRLRGSHIDLQRRATVGFGRSCPLRSRGSTRASAT